MAARGALTAGRQRFGATLVTGDAEFEGLPDTVVVR
jgi:hypothetical protein